VAVGGDGTFHEVLNGIKDPLKTSLGLIPAGRGNDFARAANLKLSPIKALKDILKGETAYSDFILVGGRRCLNVCGTGLDTEVLNRVKGKSNKISYLFALRYCLKNYSPYKLKVTVNGVSETFECIMAAVCNGHSFGGGMKLSPLSKSNDGLLNLIVAKTPKDGKIFKALRGFVKGSHIDKEYCIHTECEEVFIESENYNTIQLDGELYEDNKLECKIVKNGLKTFKTN